LVKITYESWKEIVIHEIMKYSFEQFVKTHIVGIPTGTIAAPLTWARGIVFSRGPIPSTEDVIREQLQGKIHYSNVSYASMPEYHEVHLDRQTNVTIPIVDVSGTKILCELAEWLTERREEE
jgi:hypothetical protein